jgi:hypothetical protein
MIMNSDNLWHSINTIQNGAELSLQFKTIIILFYTVLKFPQTREYHSGHIVHILHRCCCQSTAYLDANNLMNTDELLIIITHNKPYDCSATFAPVPQ